MTDQIKIDFDALSRLSPQVQAVVQALATDNNSDAGTDVPADGQTPAFLAARRVSTEAVPKILGVIGNRMTDVSDIATRGVGVLKALDEQGLATLVTSTPTLLPVQK